ncbi:MAG TPA: adenylate cyclase regulatory domain-containing protein [Actinomycetota bacterium]
MRLSFQQLADRAGVDEDFVRRLHALGALHTSQEPFGERDLHLVALLHRWEEAGIGAETVLRAMEQGDLSLSFLATPGFELTGRLDRTYRQYAEEARVPLELILSLHEAIGFARPDPDDRIREDDEVLVEMAAAFLESGASETAVRRMFRIYGDNLGRLAAAIGDVYRAEIEQRFREGGATDTDVMERGARLGRRVGSLMHRALVAIFERHHQHVWTGYSIGWAEASLERAGLRQRVERPPAICFVDLTGYTSFTEERGDEAAARLAASLAALVDEISLRRGGRAVRWLGDGGMFLFDDPKAAVLAGLDMAERAPAEGLPPTHVGIQAGPVIFQDGDVYGRTVNIASRIAARAGPGEVLVGAEVAELARGPEVRFEPIGPAELKGLAEPMALYRALRDREGEPRPSD